MTHARATPQLLVATKGQGGFGKPQTQDAAIEERAHAAQRMAASDCGFKMVGGGRQERLQ